MRIEIKPIEVSYGSFRQHRGRLLLFQALDPAIQIRDLSRFIRGNGIYPSTKVEEILGCFQCPFRNETSTYSFEETEMMRPLLGQRFENPPSYIIGCDGMVSRDKERAVCKQRFSSPAEVSL